MVSSNTYQAIQNWISRQQEYEATNSSPAPITDTQRKLLDKLELALPPEAPIQPEPQLENTNWIGYLQEYRARRTKGTGGIDFVEAPGPFAQGVQRWYYRVKIQESPTPFPGPNGGLFPDGTEPSFVRKKDAKKYAAKCAVEWLRKNGYMQTTQQSPPAKRQKVSLPPPKQAPGVDVTATQTQPKGIASPYNNDEVSAVDKVRQLCVTLGYPDVQYKISPCNTEGFYDGFPDLGMLGLKILPKDIGHVKNIFGKKCAKEMIAEQLLTPLTEIAAPHIEKRERILAGLGPVKEKKLPAPADS
ncbi:uncharacterized protein GGS25DRAFT_518589 [Hypoxylon fragiforme]|uniref:uncharacterized protein n=1 Tax=Hypoxylon fragiforme TaxID=63214 RepID=UPI0020C63D0F|nr:uncharacterized protein GGS25DRAFT_518589 [Hypoxylon fragiforme]KAI2612900.1 hypothetical protein GGS25DRAFT_518589 [Hypoxylon fragiforme]